MNEKEINLIAFALIEDLKEDGLNYNEMLQVIKATQKKLEVNSLEVVFETIEP